MLTLNLYVMRRYILGEGDLVSTHTCRYNTLCRMVIRYYSSTAVLLLHSLVVRTPNPRNIP